MDLITQLPLLQIHITAVFVTLMLVIVSDVHGLLWMLGKTEVLEKKRMTLLHRGVWIGLLCVMAAGFSMFISYPEYLLSLPAFQFKIVFIAMLIINAFFIGKHLRIAHEKTFASLTSKEKALLLVSGAVSTLGWIGAYTCAQFLS
jgi:cytochrome bd-type quinol oxidase subunit 2